jgi:hypothetical protein
VSGLDRLARALAVYALAALAVPSSAWAHVANVEYRFPLPVWVYALAGAVAVVGSVPAAAVASRGERARTTRNLYPPLARLHLGRIGLTVTTALLALALVAGFFNDELGFFNAATVLVWVVFWVGLGIVSALLGNVWDFVSPPNAAGRALDRVLARRGVSARAYPAWLGVWPSVFLLLVFSWIELVWEQGQQPRTTAVLVSAYLAVQLLAMGIFGAEIWLARGELFTGVARTFGRFAPLEFYVLEPAGPCRAGRCGDDRERLGCPTCWLDASADDRGVRLRGYGVGIRREAPLGPGGSAFAVALLATVVYDGLRSTAAYVELEEALIAILPAFERAHEPLATETMLIVVAAFGVLFLLIVALVARLEGTTLEDAAARYGPSLIPIAAVYFIAHYVLYLFYVGQLIPTAALDPLGRGWIPNYRPWTGVPAGLVWLVQAGVIVAGHVVAVFVAHRMALRAHGRPRQALVAQVPLVGLMVAYTFTGLWILGQGLAGEA